MAPTCAGEQFVDSGEEPVGEQSIDVPPVEIDVTKCGRPVRGCTHCGA